LQLELAQTKAIEIRKKGSVASEQEKQQVLRQIKEDISRLEQTQQETIRFQQQRAISKLSQQVVTLALNKVNNKLNNPFSFQVHKAVNDFNAKLLKRSSLKTSS
jgi:F0F1-type ATP synthase membrane subunit b/b'